MPELNGTWDASVATPMGAQSFVLELVVDGAQLTGVAKRSGETIPIVAGKADGARGTFTLSLTSPVPITLGVTVTADAGTLTGQAHAGLFGNLDVTGTRRA